MLQNECDTRLWINIMEMETSVCKLLIRLLRSSEEIVAENERIKVESQQLASSLRDAESRLG